MTTKLIQELVGLCVEKTGVKITIFDSSIFISKTIMVEIGDEIILINTFHDSTPAQLQAAIDKIKDL